METCQCAEAAAYRKIDECYIEIKELEDKVKYLQAELTKCKRDYWYNQYLEANRNIYRQGVAIRELREEMAELVANYKGTVKSDTFEIRKRDERIIRLNDEIEEMVRTIVKYGALLVSKDSTICSQEVKMEKLREEMAEQVKTETLRLWKENRKLRAQFTNYKEAVFAVMYGG